MGSFSTSWGLLIDFIRRSAPPLAALAVFAFSFALDVFDSFGVEERSDRSIEYLGGMLGAPLYGGETRQGQKDIAVVLINMESADALGFGGWPMPYALQAEMVERIAAHRPKAIFLDFSYSRLQQNNISPEDAAFELEDFARRIARVQASGIPVIVGPVKDVPELAPLRDVQQAGVTFFAVEEFSYRLRDTQGRPMAALSLRNVWCKDRQPACPEIPRKLEDDLLAIEWGFGASALASAYLPEEEARLCAGATPADRRAGFLNVIQRGAFFSLYRKGDDEDPLYFRCPYFDTTYAHWLFGGSPDFDGAKFITDRVVLVGADIPWLSDYAPTPLLGKSPGVTAHAMALDNLIQHGPRILRYPRQVWLGLDWSDILECVLVLSGLMIVIVWSGWRRDRGVQDRNLPWTMRIFALVVPGAIGVLLSTFYFRWPMVNVLAIVAVGSVVLYAHDLAQGFARAREGEASGGGVRSR